jgi:DNA-binding SARP family transcriptional activator/5-carboxymethyl-2-hydroxymuconate isomerase
MATLELHFLGDLEVIRHGETLPLPPSKKTRALLAYLALSPRSHRRDALCELLWQLPDDPRGSLRWSLSKLRRLVDDEDRPRIVADRASVGFDASGVSIDVISLQALAESDLERASTEVLEEAAGRYRGHFLEGLELPDFHEFHVWCVAEREGTSRAKARILRALVDRLGGASERARPHARALVSLCPYDEEARAALIRLLVASGRAEEAEQQYQLGLRLQREIGAESTGALHRARHAAPTPPAAAARRVESAAPSIGPSALLVGREGELELLAATLGRVVEQGRAAFVLVRGAPGIGKSRLLETAADLAREAHALVLDAGGFETEAIRPFALWIDAFRRSEGSGSTDVFGDGNFENRDRLFGALNDLVARETHQRPVAVVFDDLQWCDESSAAALHYVARMNRDRPLLGVLAARDDELRDNAAVQRALRGLRQDGLLQELRVGPLSEAAVRRLIEERAPGADSGRLSRECGGNPLLAIELARAGTSGDTGSSLEDLLRERLARFDAEGAEVLRWAAVLAPRIDVSSLVRMTRLDSDRVGAVLEAAERQAMLVPDDRGFRFSHDLVARGVYADISPTRRQVMHRRVAELLEQETALDIERAADLAHHASHSGDPELAARAMVSAGRLCLRFFANDDALALARKGLHLVESLSDTRRVPLTLELHDVLLKAAPVEDWESAAREYVALAELALDHGALAHARLGYHMASHLLWLHGQWSGAREETLQAERVIRSGSEEDHVVGMAETAKCLAMLERDLPHADALLMEARALALRRRVSHPAIPAALGMLRYHANELEEAEELFQEARAMYKSAGDRINEFQANEYLVMIAFERGGFEAARDRCRALLEIGGKLPEGSEAPFARALEGLCRYALEDETKALLEALEALRIADAKHRLAYVLTRTALLDVERGRPEQARERASEALEYAEILERATDMLLAHFALAQAALASGDRAAHARHDAAIAGFRDAPVAKWARDRTASPTSATDRG